MYTLRADQQTALANLRTALEAHGSVVCVGPTGFGKSVLIAEIARRHIELGGFVLCVVHRLELVTQLAKKLRAQGVTCGEIHPGATAFPARAQVASLQTLLARTERPPATLLIWDEAHHMLADEWSKLWLDYQGVYRLGFTATPALADGSGLGAAFGGLVVAATKSELRASGVLVPCEVMSPDRALESGELAADPVMAYENLGTDEQAVVFAASVQIAIQYTCEFRNRGITAAAVWGEMPGEVRANALADYAAGRTRVLTNVALLTEGWDHPPASVCILARRVGHLGLYDQMVGRVLRGAPGKTRAVLLDLVGATHLHGPPDEERRYALEGRGLARAEDLPDIKFCLVCGSPNTTPPCVECGYAGEMRHRKPRVLGLPLVRFAALRREDDDARAARLARWIQEARNRGYREGQAFHRFKGAFGEMPTRSVISKARALSR